MRAALIVFAFAACTNEVDPQWQLDHDRVIAVRFTPPRIATGETSTVDSLIGRKGSPPAVVVPDHARVDSPSGLDDLLVQTPTGFAVTAPPDSRLVAPRTELALEAGAPVPLRVEFTYDDTGEKALKIVWLGVHADNPVIDPVTIGGMNALAETQLTVAPATRIDLVVDFDDTHDINWLTSCGTMHDFDLATAYLRVEVEDPQSGMLGVMVRDNQGGVDWHLWPITAQ